MTHTITILGSTGSIGRQTLSVAEELGLRVAALTAEKNVDLLEAQCRKYRPEFAVMTENAAAEELKTRLADMNIRVLAGSEALCEAAALPQADTVVAAVCGFAALRPTLTAIREKKRIALANKETMVCAGQLMQAAARASGAEIIPVDSEHSAIFQCLMGCRDQREVKRLILTCSGGPFFGKSREELASVTKADALRHPNWKMGAKITIDCATLMNKGLEIIEAMRLYELPLEKVTAVIHRQSVVHSLVEFVDGAVRSGGTLASVCREQLSRRERALAIRKNAGGLSEVDERRERILIDRSRELIGSAAAGEDFVDGLNRLLESAKESGESAEEKAKSRAENALSFMENALPLRIQIVMLSELVHCEAARQFLKRVLPERLGELEEKLKPEK